MSNRYENLAPEKHRNGLGVTHYCPKCGSYVCASEDKSCNGCCEHQQEEKK